MTRAPSHAFSDVSGTRTFSCVNHNALLTTTKGAISGKTGFTAGAGYCYVGAVKRERNVHRSASGLRMAASQNIQMGGHGKASGLWG